MAIGGYSFVFDIEDQPEERVFFDPTRQRRKRVRRYVLASILFVISWAIVFVGAAVPISGMIEEMTFRWQAGQFNNHQSSSTTQSQEHGHSHGIQPTFADYYRSSQECAAKDVPAMAAMASATTPWKVYGHLPTAQAQATLSLASNCGELDVAMPDWFTFRLGADGLELQVQSQDVRQGVDDFLREAPQTAGLLPTLSLSMPLGQEGILEALLEPTGANRVLKTLVATARGYGANGVCLDFNQLNDAQISGLKPFFARADRILREGELTSCVVLPADQTAWADQSVTQHFDQVVLKAFHQPWAGSIPSPLADEAFFRNVVEQAIEKIGYDRLTIAIGAFAARWTIGQPLPEFLPYGEALQGIALGEGEIGFSPEAANGFSTYRDADGRSHRVWMLDAVSAFNQLSILDELGVTNVAVWSLGQEDPGLWPLFAADIRDRGAVASALSSIRLSNYIHYQGEGPFLRILSKAANGLRFVQLSDQFGRVENVEYARLPEPYSLERYGKAEARKLVLTFDDGPHPEYTRDILDTLQEAGVPGAFFVVGARVLEEPGLLVRMFEEGHEVGSHTFSHPRMDEVSRSRSDLELSMMQKLIAGYAGRETRLYREPFQRAGGPIAEERVVSLAAAQAGGAIIAGMEIVPKDWEGLSTQEIVDYVHQELQAGNGNVLLFHDGGENREATVAAIPILIRELTALGYEFTTLGDLLGIAPDVLMPPIEGAWPIFDKVSFELLSVSWFSLKTIFWVVLCIGIFRAVMVFILVLLHKEIKPLRDSREPKVSIVIPAHNEEKGIANSVRRVLQSDYSNFDVILVDDGSTDGTFAEMQKLTHNYRVHAYAQLNRGKWSAMNTAIRHTDAEIVICIDADTQIRPDAVRHMVKHFSNARVGAVAGKVVVGNRINLVTRLQALEYAISQNFERRAYDRINGMLVVPGAIGAWRTEALKKAGLYSHDTLTEDADVTISVNRAGYRVSYEDKAVAYTEAPESVRMLMRQRLRWSLGMLQNAWKHKGAMREGRVIGLVSIPDLFIFGNLLAILAPIADLFLLSLITTYFSGQWAGEFGTMATGALGTMLFAYLALPALELFFAAYALSKDRDEKLWLLLLFPFQRFFYRQILYVSTIRALIRATTGGFASWGKHRRKRHDMLQLQKAA